MSYYLSRTLSATFEEAKEKVTAALKEQGFGILTEIDVSATLKKKIEVEFKPYLILGACNPPLAHKALNTEDKIGTMLPCNVVLIQQENGIEVAAIDPSSAMTPIGNEAVTPIAREVTDRLKKALDSLA